MVRVMLTDLAIAVLCGAAFGLGCWSLLMMTSRWGARSLVQRVAPYVRDIVPEAAMVGIAPGGGGALLRDIAVRPRDRMAGILGGSASIARRLAQAGRDGGVEGFRGRQLAWGLAGLLAGALGVVALALAGALTPPAFAVPILAGVGAMLACDVALSAAARRRATRIQEELPTVLEFVSLCLAAGEGLLDSLRRVTAAGTGEFLGELRAAVIETGTGSNLADALGRVSWRLQLPGVTRAVDQLVAALDRGAPLAGVLQAQASDAREEGKRALIERAGRNEIGMLLPVVFLILPLSVIFALFPAGQLLELGMW